MPPHLYSQRQPQILPIAGTSLSILQWTHFVPVFDDWFPQFLQEWGDANGVEVSVENINTADIPAAFAGEISAGSGHDFGEHIASLSQYEESVLDLADGVAEAERHHGPQLDYGKVVAIASERRTTASSC